MCAIWLDANHRITQQATHPDRRETKYLIPLGIEKIWRPNQATMPVQGIRTATTARVRLRLSFTSVQTHSEEPADQPIRMAWAPSSSNASALTFITASGQAVHEACCELSTALCDLLLHTDDTPVTT